MSTKRLYLASSRDVKGSGGRDGTDPPYEAEELDLRLPDEPYTDAPLTPRQSAHLILEGTQGGRRRLLPLLALSLLIHIIIISALSAFDTYNGTEAPKEGAKEGATEAAAKLKEAEKSPDYIVVDLPKVKSPLMEEPKETPFVSTKSQSVEKEGAPLFDEAPRLRSAGVVPQPPREAAPESASASASAPRPGEGVPQERVPTRVSTEASGDNGREGGVPALRVTEEDGTSKWRIATGDGGIEGDIVAPTPSVTDRERIFPTPEKITMLTKEYEERGPLKEKTKSLQLNTKETKYAKYLLDVRNRVELFWEYPPTAMRNNWTGTVNIELTIMKDGTVKGVEVLKNSPHAILDDGAVTAIKLAGPFPPFPENFNSEEITVKGQFRYTRRSY